MKRALAVLLVLGAFAQSAFPYEQEDLDRFRKTGNCEGCILDKADLSGEMMRDVNLRKAFLREANLSGANLEKADLSGAVIWNSDLGSVRFYEANLSGADLNGADLTNAHLGQADLRGTYFSNTDMTGVIFEPKVDQVPDYSSIVEAKNLDKLIFTKRPYALMYLRSLFKEYGHRDLEREITYALKVSERLNAGCISYLRDDGPCTKRNFKGRVEAFASYVLFDITSNYSMSPGRPLLVVLILVIIFAAPYTFAVTKRTDRNAGIWQIWPDDRVHKRRGINSPRRVTASGFRSAMWALYFSLLSAVHIGWRDLNIGTWIARINPEEYALRGTGWVRVISGVQSLISVYLIALWILSYFGRPFG